MAIEPGVTPSSVFVWKSTSTLDEPIVTWPATPLMVTLYWPDGSADPVAAGAVAGGGVTLTVGEVGRRHRDAGQTFADRVEAGARRVVVEDAGQVNGIAAAAEILRDVLLLIVIGTEWLVGEADTDFVVIGAENIDAVLGTLEQVGLRCGAA